MMDEIENAYLEISRLCHQGKWRMSIPVNEKRDSDCIIISGLAAAEQRGYLKALDEVMKISMDRKRNFYAFTISEIVDQLRADYLRQEGKNGKTE